MRVAMVDSIKHEKGFDIRWQTGKKFCGKMVKEVTDFTDSIPDWCPLP